MRTSALPVRACAYDTADNMTAKTEPFKDDFSDGNYTGWAPYPTNGWSGTNGYMQNATAAGWSWYSRAQTDPSVDVQMSYRLDSGTQRMYVRPRQMNNANSDRVELVVYPTWMWLRQYVGGVMTDFGTWSNTSAAGSWYDLRVECDGANVNVWKGPKGGTMDLVKQVSTCTVTTTDNLMFVTVDSQWSFDDIRVLSDSLSTSTTLAYDSANELTSTTTDGNTTSYTYDAYGRMTAKTWGSYSATYAYRYGDKLTAVTSNFPGEGNVTGQIGTATYFSVDLALSMTDYHSKATSYTYSNTGRLSTLTAPGNKTWTYTYNGIGQPTQVAIPNGMTTAYTYDNRNRLTKIEHKDGATALDSFNYTLDAQGNITRTAQVDGSYWDYTYDDRHRLTQADRFSSASGNVKAHYAYTYDAADNMTAKVEPFKDDFNDGNYTGWAPYPANGWSAANGYMQNTTAAGWSWYSRAQTDPSVDVQLSYRLDSGTQRMYVRPRQVNNANSDRIELVVYPTWMWLRQFVGGVMTDFGTWSTASTAGSWYDLRVECDGANINIWKGPKGGTMDLVKQVSTCTVTTTDSLMFITVDSQWSFDDIRVLSDSLNTNTTLAYDNANELTSTVTDGNTTSYTYDAYGRMTGKTWGSYSATYAYRYGDKLTAVTSNFPGEGNVTYEYGAKGNRRQRTASGAATKYRWNPGWGLVSEEDGTGALSMTYIDRFADVPGSNVGSGVYRYYMRDVIGSTRALRAQSKVSLSQYEYDPYGDAQSAGDSTVTHRFSAHDWDPSTHIYFAPYRYYTPSSGRWLSRDPSGDIDGPNLYQYVAENPIGRWDSLGLQGEPSNPYQVTPCEDCDQYKQSAYDYWKRQNGRHGSDYTRHCGASCEWTIVHGDWIAWFGGWWNEQWENEGSVNDWNNNATGRSCGMSIRDSEFNWWNEGMDIPKIRKLCLRCCNKRKPWPSTGQQPPRFGPICKGIRDFFGF